MMEETDWQRMALKGMLALMVADREERAGRHARKTELVLADAGLPPAEIARLTGKSYAAVAKSIQRSRKGATNAEADDGEAD
jgi:hypothetical protein